VGAAEDSTGIVRHKKITTAFSETLGLSRPALALLLRAYKDAEIENAPSLTESVIRQKTGLGPNHVTAQKYYCRGCGLADAMNRLTNFGSAVFAFDPDFKRIDTQWLLHYHFVAPHGVGPDYWRYLTFHTVARGRTSTNRSISAQIDRFHEESGLDKLSDSSYNSASAAFISTYSNSDGLSSLNLLNKEGDEYRVGLPEPITAAAFAYALADYWTAQWGETQTVSLSRITGEDGPGPLLLLNTGSLPDTFVSLL
jgi:hypothetical protein